MNKAVAIKAAKRDKWKSQARIESEEKEKVVETERRQSDREQAGAPPTVETTLTTARWKQDEGARETQDSKVAARHTAAAKKKLRSLTVTLIHRQSSSRLF